jgi:hypothetical protein
MAKLTGEAKKIIGEVGPALIATASKDGKPNVSVKGSFRVLARGQKSWGLGTCGESGGAGFAAWRPWGKHTLTEGLFHTM